MRQLQVIVVNCHDVVLCLLFRQNAAEEMTMGFMERQPQRNSDPAPAGRVQPANSGPRASKSTGQAKIPPRRVWLWFMLVLLANYLLARFLFPSADAPVTVPYTFFKEEVRK